MAIGPARIEAYEQALLGHLLRRLGAVPEAQVIGAPGRQTGIVSFTVEGVHPHDVATVLDGAGVVRAGHHCAFTLDREHKRLDSGGVAEGDGSALDKLQVCAGVRAFRVRIRCATLPWQTLVAALRGDPEATSEYASRAHETRPPRETTMQKSGWLCRRKR